LEKMVSACKEKNLIMCIVDHPSHWPFFCFTPVGYFAWKHTKIDIMRLVFTFIESTISYALMLITMTFNIGLFFAVVTGLAVGIFFFGRHRSLAGLAEAGKLDGCASCQ
jgi:hypothetical protein